MNNVILIGRLARDPENRQTQTGTEVTRFTIAVDRIKTGEEKKADFINCVSFGKTAEFIANFFTKGRRIAISGRITTDSYTNKDGKKVYTTEVVADRAEFVDSANAPAEEQPRQTDDGFIAVPDDFTGDELPFN